ncbi:hypothetical protein [Deinococcus marmoris]|uniref:hypothetical protein n=1 Tax=Deinococcus marmoris TaxID=249408 RepID=UPI000494E13F|nr:hypothetical protein [Deinococcus marmoris]
MQKIMRVIDPSGRQVIHEITPDTDIRALLKQSLGRWLEYVPHHRHALQEHGVVVDEEALVKELQPSWVGSRLIGVNLNQSPPLRGPIVIVPHDSEGNHSPKQQHEWVNPVNVYARALEGDVEALVVLGLSSPEQITVIEVRPPVQHHIYLIHPDGHTERFGLCSNEESRWWIARKLGQANRLPDYACTVKAYTVLFSVAPRDKRPNLAAQQAAPCSARWCSCPQKSQMPPPPISVWTRPSAEAPPPSPNWASPPTGAI